MAALYIWLSGHWFGWAIAFIPSFILFQLAMHEGPGADAPETSPVNLQNGFGKEIVWNASLHQTIATVASSDFSRGR
ncbi:MAG TPA: hypothetical protein VEK34_11235 [Methylocella sp.]|nr:hypothetical protein [Methylocella sp.]